ncbi:MULTISPECIES: type II secretion system protein GspL [Dickeya]|uniref:Type II secretion system protein L n=1 Tax=Dickeya zeae (strain Ech586) TaxID=590409 RepID=D2BSQ4_DICZ5|nr:MULTISPECIES: type II secretion system protein GspL [Dickeya]ACZ77667.1 general secretion pathway protein L [Dickeya parazeae Ech586]MBP2835716.1 type II secretion system protein GspL [Dickeya parazeae]UCZ74546.1 type II secretion system protein GspL [Dickeya zeae]
MNKAENISGKQQLILRLPTEASGSLEWLIWSVSRHQALSRGMGTLENLQSALVDYPVMSVRALVPSTDVTLHNLSLPRQSRRQLLQAIPFMLEEQVASDIDQLHFAVMDMQGDTATVAVVQKSRLQAWLTLCEALGVPLETIMPDVMALPRADSAWSAISHQNLWLFRQDTGVGMAAEESWYQSLLSSFQPLPAVHCYSPVPASALTWQPQPVTDLLTLAAQAALPMSMDLRQGEYAPVKPWKQALLPWRNVLIALSAWLLLVLGESVWTHYQLYRQADYWRQESVRVYRKLFPDEKQVVNPRAQMQRHLQEVRTGGSGFALTEQMNRLQQLVAQNDGVSLQSLSYDRSRDELRLSLRATSYAQMEQFRQQAQAYFQIPPGEMKQEKDHVEGQLTLRSQP